MTQPHPLLPDIAWPSLAPFWAGAAVGDLILPRCESCGTYDWYPSGWCRGCQRPNIRWASTERDARIFSFTTVRRAFLEAPWLAVPYTVAVVDLLAAPGVKLVVKVGPFVDPSRLEIDGPARVDFLEIARGIAIPIATLPETSSHGGIS